jgi:DNA-binding LacI/PurR family transcriptional regulator
MTGLNAPECAATAPKYRQIYQQLRQWLLNREYVAGDRLPSENELVERFGASRPTVSRALAQLESEGFVERRAGAGTFVNARHGEPGYVFGLLIPGLGTTEIFEPICRGISMARVAGRHDLLWGATFSAPSSEEEQALQLCAYYVERRVSGVFFAPMEGSGEKDEINQRICHLLDVANIPIVLLDRDIVSYPRRSGYDLVAIDNRRAGHAIAGHVLQSGARRVVFLALPGSAPTVAERALGCREAIHACGLDGVQGWTEFGDPGEIPFVQSLMARHAPDAFVCANDLTAAKLMTSLSTLGIAVPTQVKVTGMDDIRYAGMLQTPLTTIQQPCMELGATAMAAMVQRIAHPAMPGRDYLVNFQLVIRQSSTPAAAHSPHRTAVCKERIAPDAVCAA